MIRRGRGRRAVVGGGWNDKWRKGEGGDDRGRVCETLCVSGAGVRVGVAPTRRKMGRAVPKCVTDRRIYSSYNWG